ncbi:MAG: hypothetical protein ABJC26_11625 [Gemmatimonadaceae bacterium]
MTLTTLDVAKAVERLKQRYGNATDESHVESQFTQRWEQEVLWRIALTARIDREAVQNVVAPEIQELPSGIDLWEWLLAHPDVDSNEGTSQSISLRDRSSRIMRTDSSLLGSPLAAPQSIRAFALKLGNVFVKRAADWQFDGISLLVIGDTERAWKLAFDLYQRAEHNTDFTSCFRILQVMEERLPLIQRLISDWHPPLIIPDWMHPYRQFLSDVGEMRRRYDAARAFATDFERTSKILERQVMRDVWKWLIARADPTDIAQPQSKPDEDWILNIEAQGGAGKTIFLRWLSAHKCIRHGVPYARLDFDFVDPRLTNIAPWYLIAQCARILDAQLEGRPLREIVARADEIASFDSFALGAKYVSRAIEQLRSERANEVGNAVIGQFARALAASSAKAVVIVLDTLEVAFLDQGSDVQKLLQLLAEVHRACPKLRVILSGRFSIEQNLPFYKNAFGKDTRSLLLSRLSATECAEYLSEVRSIRRTAVIDAIVTRSDGLPFSLSMFADEYELNPAITVEEIKAIPGPDLHYLVERVLKRVPPQIAWLLRYGVAAKQLTKTFLAEVIVPELERLREGKSVDNPLLGNDIVARYYDAKKLALGESVLSADLLWEDLERYASKFSFVDRNPLVPNCLVIHNEVIEPLRAELHDSAIMQRLHRRAQELAESRSEALTGKNESEWAEERATALYHALRISESEGIRTWHLANEEAARIGAFEAQATVATEIIEAPDVTDDFRNDAMRIRTGALLEVANFSGADAASRIDEARDSYNAWNRFFVANKKVPTIPLRIAYVRLLALTGEVHEPSLVQIEGELPVTLDTAEKLAMLRALVEGGTYREVTPQYINEALEIVSSKNHSWNTEQVDKFKIVAGSVLSSQGQFGAALQLSEELLAVKWQKRGTATRTIAWHIDLLVTCDMGASVAKVVERVATQFSAAEKSGAEVDLDEWEARQSLCLSIIRAFIYGAKLAPDTFGVPATIVDKGITEALIARLSMQPAEALVRLQEARSASPSTVDSAAQAIRETCTVATNLLGDFRRAGENMGEISTLALYEGSDSWLDFQFKSCMLNQPWAEGALRKLQDFHKGQPTVMTTLCTSLSEIAHDKERYREASLDVLKTLGKIQPIEARRRVFFDTIFSARRIELHPDAREELPNVLSMKAGQFDAEQSITLLAVLQDWMLNKWMAPDRIAEFQPLTVRNALDLSKWYCDTECQGRFVGLTDEMLNASDISEFARGVSYYASAVQLFDERNVEKAIAHAQRSREILASEAIPASIWLARANVLLYRLGFGGAADSDVLLLTAEDLCERLDAQKDLVTVRDLLRLREVGRQLKSDRRPILSFDVNPEDVAALKGTRTAIVTAFNTDVARTTVLRSPNNVVAELSKNFFDCVSDLAQLVPNISGDFTDDLRVAVVCSHPTVAALPLEIAIAKDAFERQTGTPLKFLTGWRSVEPLHEPFNERWALRALNSLGIKSKSDTADFRTLTSAFQSEQQLPVSGWLDAPTLRLMVRSLRGNRKTRVAIIPARTQPWLGAAQEVLMRFYSQAKAEITLLSGATRETIATLQSQQFDVVHMFSPVVESSSYGGLAFNLHPTTATYTQSSSYAEDPSADAGNPYLSLAELIGAIKRPSSLLRPVVIVHNTLDNLPLEEAMRQYCLRNIMTMELNRSGAPVAAVGISTKILADEQSVAAILSSVLTNGEPLIEFLNRVGPRKPSQNAPEASAGMFSADVVHELQSYGSVVYATNPEYVIV